jgi:hypothetical protein
MRTTRRAFSLGGLAIALLPVSACSSSEARSIKVYKLSECTCCEGWAKHLTDAGFQVSVEPRGELAELFKNLSVPDDLTSCHVGVVGSYAMSGHVPAQDIKKFLSLRPSAKGLAVPGMPINSPGMEIAGEPNESYKVWQFEANGKRTIFAEHS